MDEIGSQILQNFESNKPVNRGNYSGYFKENAYIISIGCFLLFLFSSGKLPQFKIIFGFEKNVLEQSNSSSCEIAALFLTV